LLGHGKEDPNIDFFPQLSYIAQYPSLRIKSARAHDNKNRSISAFIESDAKWRDRVNVSCLKICGIWLQIGTELLTGCQINIE
jgi:hypothetical protein